MCWVEYVKALTKEFNFGSNGHFTSKLNGFHFQKKQVWHWPYEAPGIVDSGLYAITIVCGPKDMSQEKYILI